MKLTSYLFKAMPLLLLVVSCSKDYGPAHKATCPYDSSLEGMKEWYFFKTGSWWVYQEQTSGLTDTVRVYEHFEGLSPSGYDAFSYRENHTLDDFEIQYYYNSSWDRVDTEVSPCMCRQLFKSRYRPGDYIGECAPFLYPLYNGNYAAIMGSLDDGTHTGRSTLTYPFSTITEGGDTLRSIAKWDVDTDISMNGIAAVYLLEKNKGMVQLRYPSLNQVWNLIAFEVVQ